MSSPRHFTSEEMALNKQVAEFTMKVARPLIWHNPREPWPKRLSGGTCFILRFNAGLVGITANHVIEVFEEAIRQEPQLVCLLRTVLFDLASSIIDRDAELDIATFSITEEQLIGSEAVAIDCRAEWPPPRPDKDTALSLAGFPEELKNLSSHSNVEFRAYVNMCFAEDVTTNDIIATYEPQRDMRIREAPGFPSLGANLSGCSGGPVLMHIERNGCHRWFPVGIIVAGADKDTNGANIEFDIIRIRRINALRQDGTINRPSPSWLPFIPA
ncbi:MAG: hypothetical protein ACLPID_10200 [Beijerinckiaceae bacterium]